MTNEELLRTRYEVVASYPFSKLPIGCILEFDQEACWITFNGKYYCPEGENYYGSSYWIENKIQPNQHPEIFKRLEWWEQITKDQMPEYIKHIETGGIEKPDWYDDAPYFDIDNNQLAAWHFLPATLQDYNNKIK